MSMRLTMNGATARAPGDLAAAALNAAATFWYVVAVAGQCLFVYYVAALYGGAVLRSDPARWNKVVPHAHVAGDTLGNAAMGVHVLLAIIVIVAGTLQLLPPLRRVAPAFHRWSGRIYVALAVASSTMGLYMVWIRGSSGDFTQHVGISVDALLILLCAAMAVRHARAGGMAAHRRWALRLFLAVSAVWFYRIAISLWLLVNRGPVGFDPVTFTGPLLNVLTFAQTAVPLAILELYLRAREHGTPAARMAMAALLALLTIAMGAGTVAAALILWLPHI